MASKSSMRSSRSFKSKSSSESSSTVMWVIIGLLVVAILLMIFMSNYKFFEKFTNPKPVLKYFYMDSCRHCDDFNKKTWNTLETDIIANPDKYAFTIEKINMNDSGDGAKLAKDLEIKGAPTIMLFLTNGTKHNYDGDRTLPDLIKFVENKLK